MGNTAIRVENLGKQYQLGGRRNSYEMLRDRIANAASHTFKRLFQSAESPGESSPESFWALDDVSFEVQHGEVVGIIGRNGAGKSTLMKVLSRITRPTRGRAQVFGRIGSLLEVGTGFHPELTGRENIYLNGVILGMTKAEIDRKFEEIVEFAEMGSFLDTPVKRYSSGMQLRLGFSVAAHLEAEVLVIDEVLAVGDAAFQRKCLSKMQDVARASRTVLFVSHNMATVMSLCQRAIVLSGGQVDFDGTARDGVRRYLQLQEGASLIPLADRQDRSGNQRLRISAVVFEDAYGNPVVQGQSGQDLAVVIRYTSSQSTVVARNVQVGIDIRGQFDERLFNVTTTWKSGDFDAVPEFGEFRCLIPRLPLTPGRYTLDLYLGVASEKSDYIANAVRLDVDQGDFFGTGRIPPHGYLLLDHTWSVRATELEPAC